MNQTLIVVAIHITLFYREVAFVHVHFYKFTQI